MTTEQTNNRLGRYITCSVTGESYQAFLPSDLPPIPPIDLVSIQQLFAKANQALGKLDNVSDMLPNSHLLLYYYVRKEAVLSSQIEGTQSSLSDLLLYESNEIPLVPLDDVIEVSSYVAALNHGLKRVQEGFPLSLRLIREMHKVLLSHGRGSNQQPGEFRRSQNWIGGSRSGNAAFVPPPPEYLMDCLGALEEYLHLEQRPYASLIDAALIHVQFESIHPFLDGNGRIGRLLITFFLMMMGDLKQPVLYLSLFFKNNRTQYYECLSAVRTTGDWEGWIKFFLTGVVETANQVIETSHAVSVLFQQDREKIKSLKRAGISANAVHKQLQKRALLSVKQTAELLDVTIPTARIALNNLKKQGIVDDIKGTGKERLYIYKALMMILERGAEPISL